LQRYENSTLQNLKENQFVSSSILNRSFNRITESFTDSKLINSFDKLKELSSTEKFVNNFNSQSFKTLTNNILKSVFENSSEKTTNGEKTFYDSFEKITSDIKNVISKIQIDKSSESYKSEINLLSEKINNSFSKLDKVTERISTSSVRSFNVEKIINNNFITKDFRETFKSLSLETLQKEFHIPAFASGGAVFGPTLAILGEGFGISRSNPEFVGTASQLKGIQGGTFDVNVNVDGDISFSMGQLMLALNREQRSQLRTGGKKPL
jgi:hypothetical protein